MTDLRIAQSTAYHEAGHIVVAARLGLRLSHHGIRIDCAGYGVAFYDHLKPDGCFNGECKATREQTIITLLAGFLAQQKFYFDTPESFAAGDNEHIDKLLHEDPNLDRAKLKPESDELVNDNWDVILEIGKALRDAPCTDRQRREPFVDWSKSYKEKMLDGLTLQRMLAQHRIPTVLWDSKLGQPPRD